MQNLIMIRSIVSEKKIGDADDADADAKADDAGHNTMPIAYRPEAGKLKMNISIH